VSPAASLLFAATHLFPCADMLMCIHACIHIIYVDTYMCVCVCVRERESEGTREKLRKQKSVSERERKRKRERERAHVHEREEECVLMCLSVHV